MPGAPSLAPPPRAVTKPMSVASRVSSRGFAATQREEGTQRRNFASVALVLFRNTLTCALAHALDAFPGKRV